MRIFIKYPPAIYPPAMGQSGVMNRTDFYNCRLFISMGISVCPVELTAAITQNGCFAQIQKRKFVKYWGIDTEVFGDIIGSPESSNFMEKHCLRYPPLF